MPLILVGGLYLVADHKLSLPPDGAREVHDRKRPFVVLTGSGTNFDPEWPVVSGAPVSSSTRYRTRYDVQLAAREAGVAKKCWIRVTAVQPLEKSKLGDLMGVLDEARLRELYARYAEYLEMPGAAHIQQ